METGDSENERNPVWGEGGAAVAALCDWHPPYLKADKVVGTPEKGGREIRKRR